MIDKAIVIEAMEEAIQRLPATVMAPKTTFAPSSIPHRRSAPVARGRSGREG
jgi:hypothetical protein